MLATLRAGEFEFTHTGNNGMLSTGGSASSRRAIPAVLTTRVMRSDSSTDNDATLLREAIGLAREHSQAKAGGPFGAIVARDGVVIGRGWNQVTSTNDPTAHAEIVAIRNACDESKSFHLHGCVLYTSCEPCPMCLMAACWSRISRVVYAANRNDAAAIGFDDARFYDELSRNGDCREFPKVQLLREEAVAVMQAWQSMPGKIIY